MNGATVKIEKGAHAHIFDSSKDSPEIWMRGVEPEDAKLIEAINKGLENPDVHRYLNLQAMNPKSVTQNWLKRSADMSASSKIIWQIVVGDEPIGTLDIDMQGGKHINVASGGKNIFNNKYHGKGVSSLVSIARVMYVQRNFSQLNIIQSEVYTPNVPSWRSLFKAGYVLEGAKHGSVFIEGRYWSSLQFACYLQGHPMFWQEIPKGLSDDRVKLILEELRAAELGEKAEQYFHELNAARPDYESQQTALWKKASEVIKFGGF